GDHRLSRPEEGPRDAPGDPEDRAHRRRSGRESFVGGPRAAARHVRGGSPEDRRAGEGGGSRLDRRGRGGYGLGGGGVASSGLRRIRVRSATSSNIGIR